MSLKLRLSGNTNARALTQLLCTGKVVLDALNEGLQITEGADFFNLDLGAFLVAIG